MKAAVWSPTVPMRIAPDSPATPGWAMSTFSTPFVRFRPAPEPSATLADPVVSFSASWPTATFLTAVVLSPSALLPSAMLLNPVVLEESAWKPVARLSWPMVFSSSAREPVVTLAWPLVLLASAKRPIAMLSLPLVLSRRAECPTATLAPPEVSLGITRRPKPTLKAPVKLSLKRSSPAATLSSSSKYTRPGAARPGEAPAPSPISATASAIIVIRTRRASEGTLGGASPRGRVRKLDWLRGNRRLAYILTSQSRMAGRRPSGAWVAAPNEPVQGRSDPTPVSQYSEGAALSIQPPRGAVLAPRAASESRLVHPLPVRAWTGVPGTLSRARG